MLNQWDWHPHSMKIHFNRCWMLSETVWAILQFPTMSRLWTLRKKVKIHSWAYWAKMMNQAGWLPQTPKQSTSAEKEFCSSRWSLTNWLEQDGGGDTANSLCECDKKYRTVELGVPVVITPEMDDVSASPAPTAFAECMKTHAIISIILQLMHGTFRPGISPMRLFPGNAYSKIHIVYVLSDVAPKFVIDNDSGICWNHNLLPVHIASLAIHHIEIGIRQRHGESSSGAWGTELKIDILIPYFMEIQFMFIYCYVAVFLSFHWLNMRGDNLSVHVQGLYLPCASSWGQIQVTQSWCQQWFRTVTSNPGLGPNLTVAELAVRVINTQEPPTRVQFNGSSQPVRIRRVVRGLPSGSLYRVI